MKLKNILLFLCCWIANVSGAGNFVTLQEITEDSGIKPLDSLKAHFLVDINSTVEIKFNPFAILTVEELSNSDKTATLSSEIEYLKSALDIARVMPDLSMKITKNYQELHAKTNQLSQEKRSSEEIEFRKLLNQHADMDSLLFDALAKSGASQTSQDSIDSLWGMKYYEGLANLLVERIQITQQRIEKFKKASSENDSLFLKVWCIQNSSKREPAQIHLNNYDNLPTGGDHLVEKVTLNRTPAEEEDLQRSTRFYAGLIRFSEDMQKKDSELRKTLDELLEQAKSDIKDLRGLFKTDELLNVLDECRAELEKLPDNSEVSKLISDVKALRTDLAALSDLKKMRDDLIKTLEPGQGNPLTLFILIQEKFGEISDIETGIKNLITEKRITGIEAAINNTVGSLEKILDKHANEKLADIKSNVDTKYKSWQKQITELQSNIQIFQTIYEMAKTLTFTEKTVEGLSKIDLTSKISTIDSPLKTAPPTALDLTRTNREEKDSYDLHIQAYRKNGLTQIPVYNADYTFRAMKMGWYNKWTGGLQFALMDKTTDLIPATSVMWTLHHRNDDGISMLSNVVDFGFGISSCIMSKEGNIEYGAGATLTFFSDILQAGYGFNIQQNKGYYFFGVALLDLLQASHALGEKK